jgi:hypothetical protein
VTQKEEDTIIQIETPPIIRTQEAAVLIPIIRKLKNGLSITETMITEETEITVEMKDTKISLLLQGECHKENKAIEI